MSHQFTDSEGRNWIVPINVATMKRVKDACDVDLTDAVNGKLIEQLLVDMIKFVDVLYILCKDDADKLNVTDFDFGRSLGGDSLEAATEAFCEALVDFFPKTRREVMRKARRKRNELDQRAAAVLSKQLDNPELDKEFDKILSERGNLLTNLRESLDSTPVL